MGKTLGGTSQHFANKSKATWNAHRRGTELFLESCHKVIVAEVGRADMLAFKTYLKRQKFSGRSPYNHFLNIAIFFAWAKGEEDRWVLTTMIGRRDLSVIQRCIPKRRLRSY
jgi:hypothetical protein